MHYDKEYVSWIMFITCALILETFPTLLPYQPLNVDKNLHPLTALQNIFRPQNAVQSRSLKPLLERCLGKPIQVIVLVCDKALLILRLC